MASLRKLGICGIRSFGPSEGDEQLITFDKPLTVIVGRNGCGKTTIIEALRYVTAQKEPAGKGVFVHDPHLTEDLAVKGYVKLLIKDAKGDSLTISRSMQATRTKSGITTKSLDCTITRKDPITRQPVSVSSRCVDITSEITRIFGVSRAILENVIFCTQDDSHWPLDTDQKLKEKFDQIFDSEKYNKCLKKVRDKRKSLLEEKNRAETELKFLKENKTAAMGKRKQSEKLTLEVEELRKKVISLDESLIPIECRLRELHQNEVELSKVHTIRETTKTELKILCKAEDELRLKIDKGCYEFIGADDELSDAIKACEKTGKTGDALKLELKGVENEEKRISLKQRQVIIDVSQFKKLSEMNEEKINQKKTLVEKLAAVLELDSCFASEETMERKIHGREKEFKKFIENQEAREEVCRGEIDIARANVIRQEGIITQKESELNDNRQECKKLRREVEDVEASQAKLDRTAQSFRKASQDLEDHMRINNVDDLKSDVRRWQADLNKAEEQLSSTEDDVRMLQEQTSVLKELELHRDAMAEKFNDMRRLKSIHEDALQELLGTVPESGFKRAIEAYADTSHRQLRELQSSQTKKEKEVTTFEGNRKFLKDSLMEKNADLVRLKEQVYDATGGDNWNEKVQTMQRLVDELQEEKGTLTSSSLMYQRYIRQLQRPKPSCPLCLRDFAVDSEPIRLAEDLADRMRDVPNRIERNKRELDENQDKLNKLLSLKSVQERVSALEEREIPSLSKELNEVEKSLAFTRKELDSLISLKHKPEKDVSLCSMIQGDMTLIDQYALDYERIKREVNRLEMRLPSGGPKQGLVETITKQDELRRNRKLAHHNLNDCQSRLNKYNETLQSLQNLKHSLADDLRRLEGAGGSRKALEDRCCELQALEAVLSEEVTTAREELYPLKESLNRCLEDLKNLKETNKIAADNERSGLDSLRKQFDEIKRLQSEIASFILKGVEKKLLDLQTEADNLEKSLQLEIARKSSINTQIGDTAKTIVRRRELEDNRSLREMVEKHGVLDEKIKELEKKFGNMNYDALMKDKKRLKMEEEDIGKDKARINGRIEAVISQCNVLEQELKNKIFRNIDDDYKKALVGYHVADSTAMDLFRYATCMEYAMSVYHKQQMERVNTFVREYWRKIYQGNDVEYIEIQTEECEVSDKRRNYSYRLVQVKNGVRLDMRNRCSAGQKMLSCLIIRMALAEVFSGSCGILTLDEPTTNLDNKNITTLARALNEIIAAKEIAQHSNFQIIVITHDENFLQELMQVHAIQSYVEVYRDANARSKVRRHELAG